MPALDEVVAHLAALGLPPEELQHVVERLIALTAGPLAWLTFSEDGGTALANVPGVDFKALSQGKGRTVRDAMASPHSVAVGAYAAREVLAASKAEMLRRLKDTALDPRDRSDLEAHARDVHRQVSAGVLDRKVDGQVVRKSKHSSGAPRWPDLLVEPYLLLLGYFAGPKHMYEAADDNRSVAGKVTRDWEGERQLAFYSDRLLTLVARLVEERWGHVCGPVTPATVRRTVQRAMDTNRAIAERMRAIVGGGCEEKL